MTNEPSPRPWSLFVHDEQEGGDAEISICAGGEWIATMNLRRSTAKADAALIMHNADRADDCRRLVMAREKELLADIAYAINFYAGLIGCSLDEVVRLGEKRRAAVWEGEK